MNGLALGVERPKLIGELVLERIRDLIVSKELAPGERLNAVTLASMLKVSKTPVREALLQLRLIGLVEPEGSALRVVAPSPELVQQAYEVRAGLEALTAGLAAERASDEDLGRIAESANRSNERAQFDDVAGFRDNDREFHRLVANASRNEMAARQVMNYRDLCQALRQREVMTDQVSKVCGEAHLAIAGAMTARDADGAKKMMSDHVLYVMARVLGSMQSD